MEMTGMGGTGDTFDRQMWGEAALRATGSKKKRHEWRSIGGGGGRNAYAARARVRASPRATLSRVNPRGAMGDADWITAITGPGPATAPPCAMPRITYMYVFISRSFHMRWPTRPVPFPLPGNGSAAQSIRREWGNALWGDFRPAHAFSPRPGTSDRARPFREFVQFLCNMLPQ